MRTTWSLETGTPTVLPTEQLVAATTHTPVLRESPSTVTAVTSHRPAARADERVDQQPDGHFGPGQRIRNFVLIGSLAALIGSGIGLAKNPLGLTFVVLDRVHRWAAYMFMARSPATSWSPARCCRATGRCGECCSWPGWTSRHS
ncbi:MAG TPA: hypothetical protein VE441_09660 [Mycobacterium sp.]|jgi:hypothetical protein|nr:hypothetical protein [Mycobacterium sp.]